MTTTLPVPAPTATPAITAGCPIALRALDSAAGDLARALTGIAFDEPCRPARQRALLEFSAGVLPAARGLAVRTRDDRLAAACDAVVAATPLFGRCISSGAPGLARAWTALAEALDAHAGQDATGHDHDAEDLVACERRFRAVTRGAGFAVPWFLDACTPRERVTLVLAAPRRLGLVLRLGEDRWLGLRDAVRGATP